jgi:bacterioferritin (cytochrome b1)
MLKNENYTKFAEIMLSDLMNERKHMLFYLTAASTVSGLHREEYKELFEKEASGEMSHVVEFQNCILGLGVDLSASTKVISNNDYIVSYDLIELLKYALAMEEEVVSNYAKRIAEDILLLDEPEKRWMEIFYEDQLEKSRKDVDNYKMILRGCK